MLSKKQTNKSFIILYNYKYFGDRQELNLDGMVVSGELAYTLELTCCNEQETNVNELRARQDN